MAVWYHPVPAVEATVDLDGGRATTNLTPSLFWFSQLRRDSFQILRVIVRHTVEHKPRLDVQLFRGLADARRMPLEQCRCLSDARQFDGAHDSPTVPNASAGSANSWQRLHLFQLHHNDEPPIARATLAPTRDRSVSLRV